MASYDIGGPGGNAFAIMSTTQTWSRQMQRPADETAKILADMREGDYKNMLAIFYRAFQHVWDGDGLWDSSGDYDEYLTTLKEAA